MRARGAMESRAAIWMTGLLAVVAAPAALAVNPATGTLANGDPIEIVIDRPADGSVVPLRQDLLVRGRTNIPEVPQSSFANVLYVVDVSGSTGSPLGQDCDGSGVGGDAGDDFNGDGSIGDTLDCEISGVVALNDSLSDRPEFDGGMIVFGSAATIADVSPLAGDQAFTTPLDVDLDGNLTADLEDVARSLDQGRVSLFRLDTRPGTGTNFDAALTATRDAFATQPAAEVDVVYFLSDGVGTLTSSGLAILDAFAAAGSRVFTYSVGTGGAGCAAGSALLTIAQRSGGTCTPVTDPSDLAASLVGTAPPGIAEVEVQADGGTPIPASLDALGNWEALIPAAQVFGQQVLIEATVIADDGAGTRVTADVTVFPEADDTSQQCRRAIEEANCISRAALASRDGLELERNEYLTLFKAAQCRTGVPADLLQAIAFSEGLGDSYVDWTPRQFFEPCNVAYNPGNARWFNETMFRWYYGCMRPVVGFGRLASQAEVSSCSLPNAIFTLPTPETCRVEIVAPCDRPEGCSDDLWRALWGQVVHVSLGDDAGAGQGDTFGLGIMQLTFDVHAINQERFPPPLRTTLVGDRRQTGAGAPAVYPLGGNPTNCDLLDGDNRDNCLQLDNLAGLTSLSPVIRDPQYNILYYAQLVLFKWQFENKAAKDDPADVLEILDDDFYGPVLTAGSDAPAPGDTETWVRLVAQGKTFPLDVETLWCNRSDCDCSGAAGRNQEAVRCFLRDSLLDPGPPEPSPGFDCTRGPISVSCSRFRRRDWTRDTPDLPPRARCANPNQPPGGPVRGRRHGPPETTPGNGPPSDTPGNGPPDDTPGQGPPHGGGPPGRGR